MKVLFTRTRTLTIGAAVLIVGLISYGCDPTPNGGDWGAVIHGAVTDSVSGLPLDSAEVFFDSLFITFTDSTGAYSLTGGFGDPPDSIGCRMEGYGTKYLQIDVVNRQLDYWDYDFQMAATP